MVTSNTDKYKPVIFQTAPVYFPSKYCSPSMTPAHMRTDLIRPYPGFFSRFCPKIHVQKPLQKKIGCWNQKEHSPKTLSQSLVTDDIGFNDQE